MPNSSLPHPPHPQPAEHPLTSSAPLPPAVLGPSPLQDSGKIVSVRIGMDPATGRSKGFAHVDFETGAMAKKATQKAGTELDGRALKVEVAAARA